LAYRPTLAFFNQLAALGHLPRDRPISVVDVGSGSGDMLRRLDGWARPRGYKLDLVGVDLNHWSTITARQLTHAATNVRFATTNIFDYRPEAPIDIVISSLFTHHLDDTSLVNFLSWMETQTRIGWFINDLLRHPISYYFFKQASPLFGFHYFVRHDGPVSIARAFRPADWQGLLASAKISEAGIKNHFPFRLCVSRIKP